MWLNATDDDNEDMWRHLASEIDERENYIKNERGERSDGDTSNFEKDVVRTRIETEGASGKD
jgi:hypothetical protein